MPLRAGCGINCLQRIMIALIVLYTTLGSLAQDGIKAPSRSFLFPPREQIPNARVAEKEPAPNQRGENDRHEKREFLRLDAHVRRDRAAEIAGEQDRAEYRRARDEVENRRDEAGRANCGDGIFRVAELAHALQDLC
jgi:hypothetical protein